MDVQPHLLNLSAYINQNLEKDLPLSALAKRVGLSPFHFHRKFGAYFGESLHQHIKRLRLERAAFALTHGSLPVRQIARDSGYKTVSAFSHAFSGFAGESPTRYRSLSAPGGDVVHAPATETGPLDPSWIGDLPPQPFAFLRAMGRGQEVQRSARDAINLVLKLVGPLAPPDAAHGPNGASGSNGSNGANGSNGTNGAGVGARPPASGNGHGMAQPDQALECIAATSDIYGIFKGADFRIDVGVDAQRVPADRAGLLGQQTLPGGRYARYDLHCSQDETVAQSARISLKSLQERGETPRLSQYFARFSAAGGEGPTVYQVFIPLTG